jgi:lipopolysaccharide biosynthesis protein
MIVTPKRFAVVVHVYYPELWPEIQQTIMRSGVDLDWFITITDQGEPASLVVKQIRAQLPSANVWLMPNHGRDIYPWLYLVNQGVLDPYQGVCKIHTKRSPHLHDGDKWRSQLFRDLLPLNKTHSLLEAFMNTAKAGVLTGFEHLRVGHRWWGYNTEKSMQLLSRLNMDVDINQLRFPSGSMYWIKAEVIEAMKALELTFDDFEEEVGATDGTMAHAFERIVGYLCAYVDMHIQVAYPDGPENF